MAPRYSKAFHGQPVLLRIRLRNGSEFNRGLPGAIRLENPLAQLINKPYPVDVVRVGPLSKKLRPVGPGPRRREVEIGRAQYTVDRSGTRHFAVDAKLADEPVTLAAKTVDFERFADVRRAETVAVIALGLEPSAGPLGQDRLHGRTLQVFTLHASPPSAAPTQFGE